MNTSTKLKRLVRSAIYVIARKEFLKIRRDRRTLLVIVTLLSLISVGIARRKNRPWVLRHIEITEPSDTRLISPAMTAP